MLPLYNSVDLSQWKIMALGFCGSPLQVAFKNDLVLTECLNTIFDWCNFFPLTTQLDDFDDNFEITTLPVFDS